MLKPWRYPSIENWKDNQNGHWGVKIGQWQRQWQWQLEDENGNSFKTFWSVLML